MKEDRFEELMVKVVDEVATGHEREELMAFLTDKPALRRELEEHQVIKAVTDGWVERLEHDLVQARYAQRAAPRMVNQAAAMLAVFGTLVLTGGGVSMMLATPDMPLWLQAGLVALAAGLALAFGSVVHWRVTTLRDDPYNKVER